MSLQPSLHYTVRVGGMTVDELIAQADAICARYQDREAPLRAAIPPDDAPQTYSRVAELLPQLAALLREQTDELEQLDVPAELHPRGARISTGSFARPTCSTTAARQPPLTVVSGSSLWQPRRGGSSLRWQRSRNALASRSAGGRL
jgi:hypothetical protein